MIAGHSQGGHAALFAAAAARTTWPGLKLRGTVAFAPASHLQTQFPLTTQVGTPGGGLGGIIGLGLRAIEEAGLGVDVPALLTPGATALYPQTETECLDVLGGAGSWGGLPLNQIFRAGADLGPLVAAIDVNDPENVKIRTPVRVEQGDADGTVFKSFTDQLVAEYEAKDVKVTHKALSGRQPRRGGGCGRVRRVEVDPRPLQEVGSGRGAPPRLTS